METTATTTPSELNLAVTRRMYLTLKAMEAGAGMFLAQEAVASVAIEHPEWDMDEAAVWSEWERRSW